MGSLGGVGGETLVTPARSFCMMVADMGLERPVNLWRYPIEEECAIIEAGAYPSVWR